MPDVLLLQSPRTSKVLGATVDQMLYGSLALHQVLQLELRIAVLHTFFDTKPQLNPRGVAAMSVTWENGSNATDLQILVIASHTPARAALIDILAKNLVMAWHSFGTTFLPHNQNPLTAGVDVWPLLPLGFWRLAQKAEYGTGCDLCGDVTTLLQLKNLFDPRIVVEVCPRCKLFLRNRAEWE